VLDTGVLRFFEEESTSILSDTNVLDRVLADLEMEAGLDRRGLTELALGVGVCALGGSAANSQQPTTSASILPGSARRQGSDSR
jgi:hypothetical protein